MFPSRLSRWASAALCAALVASAALGAEHEPKRRLRGDPTQEYWVYLPSDFDAEKRYWLFVAVHGLGGKGENALGWAKFADEGQCIVVGPTFTGTYQFPKRGSGHGKKMVEIFKELGREYKLYPKLFITGFSAGAQFAHRFALECPELVIACAAHSAGSWGSPSSKARGVPFVVTCGEADTKRIHIARNFADDLQRKGYRVTTAWYKNVGHAMCAEARELTRELYWSATTGMSVEERQKATAAVEAGQRLVEEGKFTEAYKTLIVLARAKRRNEFSERAVSILRQIAGLGGERLMEIEKQARTDPDGAAEALAKLSEDFRGFRVARVAAARLRELRASRGPTTATAPDTAAAPEPADTKPATSTSPPRPAATQTAARWLALARNYLANHRKDLARRTLGRLIARFPDSGEAEDAKLLLMEMDEP